MRKKVFKPFFAWDYEKEEAWLNDMSEQGWQLVHPSFMFYTFEEDHSVRYLYKLELLNQLPRHAESQNYIQFLEEMGIQHVGSVVRWGYFRKDAAEGPFEIFSDLTTRIQHIKRIRLIILAVTPINVINVINMSNQYNRMPSMGIMTMLILVITIVALLGYGLYRVQKMLNQLEKEHKIRE